MKLYFARGENLASFKTPKIFSFQKVLEILIFFFFVNESRDVFWKKLIILFFVWEKRQKIFLLPSSLRVDLFSPVKFQTSGKTSRFLPSPYLLPRKNYKLKGFLSKGIGRQNLVIRPK